MEQEGQQHLLSRLTVIAGDACSLALQMSKRPLDALEQGRGMMRLLVRLEKTHLFVLA